MSHIAAAGVSTAAKGQGPQRAVQDGDLVFFPAKRMPALMAPGPRGDEKDRASRQLIGYSGPDVVGRGTLSGSAKRKEHCVAG